MKKVLLLAGSPRTKGNSSILCDEFARGATDASFAETMTASLRGFTCCVPNAKEGGIILGIGMREAGEIREDAAMQQAFEMGRAL